MAVKFNYLKKEFRIRNSTRVKYWLEEVIKSEGFNLGDLVFIFGDDNIVIEINREFLKHDWPTDVIAFKYNEEKRVNGEIYIGVETVYRNAERFKEKRSNELQRVMVHGLLHLLGYDDKKKRDRNRIRKKENEYLEKLERNEF